MESSALRSEYLQTRLREKKASSSRANKSFSEEESRLSRSLGSGGRDDGIFDLDDSRNKKKSAANSSAAGPSAWRFEDRDAMHSRRVSGMGGSTSTGSAPRAIGVREMEDHVDKLSKQNFDLKLEVYHRREQIDELERKVKELPRLEEDHAELLQMNEEMVEELERRDNAVDEAVVIICNLEEKIRNLEDQLCETRPTTAQQDISDTQSSRLDSRPTDLQSTPQRRYSKGARNSIVSPHVSARLAELATPTQDDARLSRLPSFLNTEEPGTDNLRSLFVDGDHAIRPIPSYATLFTRNDGKDNEEPELPNSPRLSTLSESDFRSIYGKEEPIRVTEDAVTLRPQILNAPALNTDELSARESKEARTTQWVADAATLPHNKPKRSHRPSSPDAGQFRSLGDILHQERRDIMSVPVPSSSSASKSKSRQPAVLKDYHEKGFTPPFQDAPVFGQSIFPPTPDTMQTRPSNQSTTSIGPERGFNEPLISHSTIQSSSIPIVNNSQFESARYPHGYSSRLSVNVRDAPAIYQTQPYQRPDADFRYANNLFGMSLFRQNAINDQPEYLASNAPSRPPITWRAVMDEDSVFGNSPPNGSPSPPRQFSGRRLSLEALSQPQVTRRRPSDGLLRLGSEPRSATAAFAPQESFRTIHEPSEPIERKLTSISAERMRLPKTPVKTESAILDSPGDIITPTEVSPKPLLNPTSPLDRVRANSLSNRAASLRKRMNKFTRRTSNNVSTPGAGSDMTTPGKAGRSNSITKHFNRLRRGSNSIADFDDQGRATAFVEAAQAAAPFLSIQTKDLPALPPASPPQQLKTSSSSGSRHDDRISRSGHSNLSLESGLGRTKQVAAPASSTGSATGSLNVPSGHHGVPAVESQLRQHQLVNAPIRSSNKSYNSPSYTAMAGAAAAAVSSTQYGIRGRPADTERTSFEPRTNYNTSRNDPAYQ